MTAQELAGELMAGICPEGMVSAVVVIAEMVVPGEPTTAYVMWDDSASAWVHEGLAHMAVRRIAERTTSTPGGD